MIAYRVVTLETDSLSQGKTWIIELHEDSLIIRYGKRGSTRLRHQVVPIGACDSDLESEFEKRLMEQLAKGFLLVSDKTPTDPDNTVKVEDPVCPTTEKFYWQFQDHPDLDQLIDNVVQKLHDSIENLNYEAWVEPHRCIQLETESEIKCFAGSSGSATFENVYSLLFLLSLVSKGAVKVSYSKEGKMIDNVGEFVATQFWLILHEEYGPMAIDLGLMPASYYANQLIFTDKSSAPAAWF